MRHYDAVLFSYGASEDKKLGIPGESTLSGIYSAREFVGWYNGLPDFADLSPDLTRGEEAVVIGQGNVALDVARMLLEDVDALRKTDVTEHALAVLAQSRIRRVRVVGRRGPMQVRPYSPPLSMTKDMHVLNFFDYKAAFTIKEVRELMNLRDVAFHPVDRSLIPEDLKALPRASKRLMEVLVKGTPNANVNASAKSWSLDNCLSPRHFLGNTEVPTNVASTEFDITNLESPHDPKSGVKTTGDTTLLPSDVVFRSVGYKSLPLSGFADIGIQFDERRGIVSNDGFGRVIRLVSGEGTAVADSQQIPGLYCAGWLKRGPTGVIASTMQDAFTTGDAIAQDWMAGKPFLASSIKTAVPDGWEGVQKEVLGDPQSAVSWDRWLAIDAAEKDRGKSRGKEREKFTSTDEMLRVLG
jgi:adrenodoxin-NADP+ reductase